MACRRPMSWKKGSRSKERLRLRRSRHWLSSAPDSKLSFNIERHTLSTSSSTCLMEALLGRVGRYGPARTQGFKRKEDVVGASDSQARPPGCKWVCGGQARKGLVEDWKSDFSVWREGFLAFQMWSRMCSSTSRLCGLRRNGPRPSASPGRRSFLKQVGGNS